MKRIHFFILVSAFIAASCNNEEKKPADVSTIMQDSSKYTTIQWLDSSVDFGSRKMGDLVAITFTCKNTGDKPLYLYNVHPSCGCTVADYTKEPIAPGQEGKINAQFDTKKSHPGEVHKAIFVTSNNSNEVPPSLKFTGIILPSDSSKTVHK
jgi:Protein of unknown function (DUF1573)